MSRRGFHEGSIYKRADGRWVACVQLGYEGTSRKRKYLYGATQREVKDKLTKVRRDLQLGLEPAPENLTLATFAKRWLAGSEPALRVRTHKRYRELLELHVLPTLGRRRLASLAPGDVQELLTTKLASGLSAQTVRHIRTVLRTALGQAERWGYVGRNAAALADPPRVVRHEVQPLSAEQARTLLAHVRGDRFEALYTVALALGLRQGEALGLRWSDVDFETATLAVRQALYRAGGEVRFVEPKSAQSRRTLVMPPIVASALRAHRARQHQERLAAGSDWQDTGLVFTSRRGTPLVGGDVTKRLQRHLQAAGLPRQRFHDLRHACASLLIAQGVHPRLVMETLGHSTITLTMNTYGHVMPDLKREPADQMESLLASS